MERQPCVYMMTNKYKGTLYIGVTSNLIKRIWEHKNAVSKGFSSKYNLKLLVWFEVHETMESAITQEKRMKAWRREWKINAIEQNNPSWRDLYLTLL